MRPLPRGCPREINERLQSARGPSLLLVRYADQRRALADALLAPYEEGTIARLAQTLSHMAVLKERVEFALQGGALTMLRLMPQCMKQFEESHTRVKLEQQDLAQLNLEPYEQVLQQLPSKITDIGPQIADLTNAPIDNNAGHFLFGWGGSSGSGKGQFHDPRYIAVSDGLVYVIDARHHCVQVFRTTDGKFVRQWGRKGSSEGQFDDPSGVAVCGGLVYITDRNNYRVQVFSASGKFVRQWDWRTASGPGCIAVSGALAFVIDDSNGCVQVCNSTDGKYVHHFGSPGFDEGQFNGPFGVAVSGDSVYVTEHHGHRAQVFSATDGKFVRRLGRKGSSEGQFYYPQGVAVCGGLVYVTDRNHHCVQVFSVTDGRYVRQWGSKGSGNEQLDEPVGIAVSGGLAYVLDHGNNRVQVFRC